MGFAIGVSLAYHKNISDVINSANADDSFQAKRLSFDPSQQIHAVFPVIKSIVLSEQISQFQIVTIPTSDTLNYSFQFDGKWSHYLLGTQNSVGTIMTPGSLKGNLKILLTVVSLANGVTLQQIYYDGTPVKINLKM